MDPTDPKRRGRRLFGSRRRHEQTPEVTMTDDSLAAPVAAPEPVDAPSDAAVSTVAGSDDGGEGDVIETPSETTEPEVSTPLPGPADPQDEGSDDSDVPGAADRDDVSTLAPTAGSVVPAADLRQEHEGRDEAATTTDREIVAEPAASDGSDDEDHVEEYELPRIFAIANQKGGVGKTTTSVNLGAALAEMGFRVLVVDLDPQGNATTGLGVNARELSGSVYDVIMNDAAVEDCVEPTTLKNLFVAPATIDLAGAEIELVPAFSRELKLRRALQEIRDDYDYVIIDCPPSLGLLTVNGLAAADDVVVPIQCEYYALEGLSQLIRNVSLVQKNLNPSLEVRGIVLTMYDARTKLADQVEQEVRKHFGRTVYQTVVPRTVRLSEAPSFGQPIILFDPTSRGAVAYRELAKEVSSGATRRTG